MPAFRRTCIPRKEPARRHQAICERPRNRSCATQPKPTANLCSNRPRVTISINAPQEPSDQELLTLDLPPGLTVKDLKGFVEAETSFPAAAQNFFLNGRPLASETQTLEEAGVNDGEMLAVLIRRRGNRPQGNVREAPAQDPRRAAAPDPEAVRQHVLSDPAVQNQLRERRPELLAALSDPVRWRETYDMMQRQEEEAERERQNQIALLNEDPFNVEAQKKIEEIIRQDNVINNLHEAYEQNPEGEYIYHDPHAMLPATFPRPY